MAYLHNGMKYRSTEELRDRLIRRMKRSGQTIAGQPLWSEDEIQVLRDLAPQYDVIGMQLKGRTYEAIRHKCNALGLSKTLHVWSCVEISKLRRLYPTAPREAILAVFPFSTWSKIKHTARNHGIRREKLPFKRSKHPLMNAILEQCTEIGWSLADLDRECETGRYFRRRTWREGKLNYDAVLKAVEILDGTVSVTWNE